MIENVSTDWGNAPRDWESPDWDHPTRVHEWKHYVSDRVKELWHSFTSEQKVAIAAQADDQASREDWD